MTVFTKRIYPFRTHPRWTNVSLQSKSSTLRGTSYTNLTVTLMSVIGLRVKDKAVKKKSHSSARLQRGTLGKWCIHSVQHPWSSPEAAVILACCRLELLVLLRAFNYPKLGLREGLRHVTKGERTLTNYREMNSGNSKLRQRVCEIPNKNRLELVTFSHTKRNIDIELDTNTLTHLSFGALVLNSTPSRICQACRGSWQTFKCHHLLTLTFYQSFCHSFLYSSSFFSLSLVITVCKCQLIERP